MSVPVTRARAVSVLFNEPKLLKSTGGGSGSGRSSVSVLFNEPKLLKLVRIAAKPRDEFVSVLFNEPKLLKYCQATRRVDDGLRFSALQRAEIAEMCGIVET